jgi:hypothetical protein
MSHYFDDILHRQTTATHGGHTPNKSPMLSPTVPRLLRRSSTSRSLAARSHYSVNGIGHVEDGDVADTPGGYSPRRGSVNPATLSDPARVKERAEADAHLHSYISQQLERVKLERGGEGAGEEFEALP